MTQHKDNDDIYQALRYAHYTGSTNSTKCWTQCSYATPSSRKGDRSSCFGTNCKRNHSCNKPTVSMYAQHSPTPLHQEDWKPVAKHLPRLKFTSHTCFKLFSALLDKFSCSSSRGNEAKKKDYLLRCRQQDQLMNQ